MSGHFSFLKMKTTTSPNYIYKSVNLENDAKNACVGARYHHRFLENIVNMRKVEPKKHFLLFHWHLRALLWELIAALDTIKKDKKLKAKDAPWSNENWSKELGVLRNRSHQCFNFVQFLIVKERIMGTKVSFPYKESGKSKHIIDIPKRCKEYIVKVEEVLNKLYKN